MLSSTYKSTSPTPSDFVNTPLISTSSTKIQPLLVSVKNPDQAKMVNSSARRLRHSKVSVICENVFINVHLRPMIYVVVRRMTSDKCFALSFLTSLFIEC